jgi:hypothetical protein
MGKFIYTVTQGGIEVARVESDDDDAAFKEIMHYAMMYSKDGHCVVSGERRKKTRAPAHD